MQEQTGNRATLVISWTDRATNKAGSHSALGADNKILAHEVSLTYITI